MSLGVVVRRGVEVGVELETPRGPVRASWVVGTDGGRSVVRKLKGIAFPGTGRRDHRLTDLADVDGVERLRSGWAHTPTGVYGCGPIPGRTLSVQFTGAPPDRSAPVTAEELQASIRLVSGVDVTALHGAATRWTDDARQADTYRVDACC